MYYEAISNGQCKNAGFSYTFYRIKIVSILNSSYLGKIHSPKNQWESLANGYILP